MATPVDLAWIQEHCFPNEDRGRSCKNTADDKEYRFHRFTEHQGHSAAVVEDKYGSIVLIVSHNIRFLDRLPL